MVGVPDPIAIAKTCIAVVPPALLVAFPAVVGERDDRGPSARRYPCH